MENISFVSRKTKTVLKTCPLLTIGVMEESTFFSFSFLSLMLKARFAKLRFSSIESIMKLMPSEFSSKRKLQFCPTISSSENPVILEAASLNTIIFNSFPITTIPSGIINASLFRSITFLTSIAYLKINFFSL
ncbi:hypothetical protein ASZ90_004042 [hydrocarbon metagenome]|uniref:Uncharacterized protein n=1 Tax=hydrocarbon metagenome TaxID=938273 RepID=A0A0W8FZ76_9ZZZZ